MQIHVVQQGQSLYGIAQAYNTTVNDIIEANEIPDPNRLVVGKHSLFPLSAASTGFNQEIAYFLLPNVLD